MQTKSAVSFILLPCLIPNLRFGQMLALLRPQPIAGFKPDRKWPFLFSGFYGLPPIPRGSFQHMGITVLIDRAN